jgi:hypothetical protein
MPGLPRKYAKMGFKRGWAAYNRIKKPRRKKSTKTQVKHMARRKRSGFKKAYRKMKSGLTFGNVTKVLIGAGLAALYEVYVSPMVPFDGLIKNIVELAAGLFLAGMGGMPMPIKAFGSALAVINAWQIVMAYLPQQGSTSTASNF